MLVIDFPENYKKLFTPIKSEKNSKDVYFKFYEWTLRKIYESSKDLHRILFDTEDNIYNLVPKGYQLDITRVYVSEEDQTKLNELFVTWYRQSFRKSKKYAEDVCAHRWFEVGPASQANNKPGLILIDINNLWTKNE